MMIEDFHFLRPLWLLLLFPLAWVVWWLSQNRLHSRGWSAVCDPELLKHLLVGRETQRRNWAPILVAITGLLTVFALAGPAWQQLPQPLYQTQNSLVVVLDLSRSMDAQDIKPSRLERAKLKLVDILKRRKEGRTALIVYAGAAFVVTPLTDDVETIFSLLRSLETELMPAQGSRPEEALILAEQLLDRGGNQAGHVLLISDGVPAGDFSRVLRAGGHKLSVLGVGTTDGAPIPLPQGGFVKDPVGSMVLAQLQEEQLINLASKGEGIYQRLSNTNRDVNALLHEIAESSSSTALKKAGLNSDRWRDEGIWLLIPLLLASLFVFRRGWLAMIPIMLFTSPDPTYAFSWGDLWQNSDQQGYSAFFEGRPDEAAKHFKDPHWKAAAHYRSAQYQQALQQLEGSNNPVDWYNRGNALARMGQYQQAVQAYEQALKQEPKFDDARYNRDLIRKALEDQKQQQEEQQSQQDQKDQQQNQSQDSNQNNQQQDQQKNQQQQDSAKNNQQSPQQSPNDQQNNRDQNRQDQQNQSQESQDSKPDSELQTKQQQAQGKEVEEPKDPPSERRLANEQWLRRIPDDPGGLLRRKFLYQYQQKHYDSGYSGELW